MRFLVCTTLVVLIAVPLTAHVGPPSAVTIVQGMKRALEPDRRSTRTLAVTVRAADGYTTEWTARQARKGLPDGNRILTVILEMLPRSPTAKACDGCVIDAIASASSYIPLPGVLADATTYYWQVQARNSTTSGDWSGIWSFTTPTVDLPAPALLAPPDGGTGLPTAPTFRWSEVAGADLGYRIMVAGRPDALPLDPAAVSCPDCVIATTVRGSSFTPAAGNAPER